MLKFFFFFTSVFLLGACHQTYQQNGHKTSDALPSIKPLDYYKVNEPVENLDNDVPNPLSRDNKVFLPGRTFVYNYTYLKNNQPQTCVVTVDQSGKGGLIPWKLSPQPQYNELNHPVEQIKLRVCKTKAHTSLANEQTIIKYEYWNKKGRILIPLPTGVVEDSSKIFLHPPRGYAFLMTEFNPFPIIKFPLKLGKTWKNENHIPPSMVEELIKINEVAVRTIQYKIDSKIILKTALGDLVCYKVIASSKGEINEHPKESKLQAFFNEEYGFVKLNYTNIDGSLLTFDLVGITDDKPVNK